MGICWHLVLDLVKPHSPHLFMGPVLIKEHLGDGQKEGETLLRVNFVPVSTGSNWYLRLYSPRSLLGEKNSKTQGTASFGKSPGRLPS